MGGINFCFCIKLMYNAGASPEFRLGGGIQQKFTQRRLFQVLLI